MNKKEQVILESIEYGINSLRRALDLDSEIPKEQRHKPSYRAVLSQIKFLHHLIFYAALAEEREEMPIFYWKLPDD